MAIGWRKAMIASFVFHVVILTSVGSLVSRSPTQLEVIEQYIELDLSQEADNQTDSAPAKGDALTATSQSVSPATASAVSSVMASSSNLSVLSSEASTNVPSRGIAGQNSEAPGQVVSGSGGSRSDGKNGSGNGGTGKGSSGYSHPEILSQVIPTYPESARRQGIEGTVILKIQILSNGRPGFVSVYRSSGNDSLDDAAIDAVQQWKFVPAGDKSTGETITCITTMPVEFSLK